MFEPVLNSFACSAKFPNAVISVYTKSCQNRPVETRFILDIEFWLARDFPKC